MSQIEVKVRVTPKASRTKVEAGDPVRVYVTAPPADGQANRAVVEALSDSLGIPKSRISIVRGESSRDKSVALEGITREELEQRLARGS